MSCVVAVSLANLAAYGLKRPLKILRGLAPSDPDRADGNALSRSQLGPLRSNCCPNLASSAAAVGLTRRPTQSTQYEVSACIRDRSSVDSRVA